jgi:hypothetical protein
MGNAKMKKAMRYVETKNLEAMKCEHQEGYVKEVT